MKRLVATCVALVAATMLTAVASAEEVDSGLEVGASVGAYNVTDVTGPNAGRKLCYRCQYGARPVVNVFTRSLNSELASLVKQLDDTVGENKDASMQGFVVLLTDDPDAAEAELKTFAEEHGIKNMPLTIFEGVAGPPNYKVSEDAEVTVLMWESSKVAANHSFGDDDLNDEAVKEIVADTSKILK